MVMMRRFGFVLSGRRFVAGISRRVGVTLFSEECDSRRDLAGVIVRGRRVRLMCFFLLESCHPRFVFCVA